MALDHRQPQAQHAPRGLQVREQRLHLAQATALRGERLAAETPEFAEALRALQNGEAELVTAGRAYLRALARGDTLGPLQEALEAASGARDRALTEVRGLVEKPDPSAAPSNLAVVGRYILQPDVMRILDSGEKGAGGEIQLTDAMARMIGSQPFHALKVDAERHDCGDKTGFVIANLALALRNEEVAPKVRAFLKDRLPPEIAAKAGSGFRLSKDDHVRWQQILFEKGWMAPGWPVELGGTGWTASGLVTARAI